MLVISNWYLFVLFSLACFRLTRLLVFDKITKSFREIFIEEIELEDENGNKDFYVKPREGLIRSWVGELLSCYWCTGVWCSIFLFCFYWWNKDWAEPIILILAIAGAGAIIETIVLRLMRD